MYGTQIYSLRKYIRALLKDAEDGMVGSYANTILRIAWQEIQERLVPNSQAGYIQHQLDWDELSKRIHKPVWFDVGYDSANNHWMILHNLFTDHSGQRLVEDHSGALYPFDDIALFDHEIFHEGGENGFQE